MSKLESFTPSENLNTNMQNSIANIIDMKNCYEFLQNLYHTTNSVVRTTRFALKLKSN